jgi:hypothetical protein
VTGVGKRCCLAAVLSILVGCASTRAIEGPVRLRQTAFVDGPKVRPEQVIEDSRCPPRIPCVWAGRLVVRVTVSGGGWSKQVDLTLGIPMVVADGMLTLVAAVPKHRIGQPSGKPPAYQFTFRFQGGR